MNKQVLEKRGTESIQKGLLREVEQKGKGLIIKSLDWNLKAMGKSGSCLSKEITQPNLFLCLIFKSLFKQKLISSGQRQTRSSQERSSQFGF